VSELPYRPHRHTMLAEPISGRGGLTDLLLPAAFAISGVVSLQPAWRPQLDCRLRCTQRRHPVRGYSPSLRGKPHFIPRWTAGAAQALMADRATCNLLAALKSDGAPNVCSHIYACSPGVGLLRTFRSPTSKHLPKLDRLCALHAPVGEACAFAIRAPAK
jgi:hypothetical protein